MKERIKIGEVEIEITFKDIKNLHLSVHPPVGHVTISSPLFYDLDKVKTYAATKLAWIKKERRRFMEQKRETQRLFKNQESHFFFGQLYLLQLELSKRNSVSIAGKKLLIKATHTEDIEKLNAALYGFYRKELRRYLTDRVQFFAAKMNLPLPNFKIRTMRTKWGSCAVANDRLWFNIELAKKPLECIDYVVVHELVHLIEKHHNKSFILLIDQYFPTWRTQKKLLNELPL